MQKYINNVQDTLGNAIGSVTVTIRDVPGGGLSSIFSDNSGTTKTNPFTNDPDGEFFFYAVDGRYDIDLTGPVTESFSDIRLLDILTSGNTLRINTDINTATPPTTEAVTGTYQIFDLANDDQLARFGYAGGNTLFLSSFMHGAVVRIQGEDAAGVMQSIIDGDPDGSLELYFDGFQRFSTVTTGVELRSNTSSDAVNRFIALVHLNGTRRGRIGHSASALFFSNEIEGGNVILEATDAGTVLRTILNADPDGQTVLRGDTSVQIQVNAGEIAIACVDNDGVFIRHNNIVRTATRSGGEFDIISDGSTDTEARLLVFAHADGTDRALIGHETSDVFVVRNEIHGGNVVITAEDAGGNLRTGFDFDPDGSLFLSADGNLTLSCNNGDGCLSGVAGAATGIFFNAALTFQTADRTATDQISGATMLDGEGFFGPVGLGVSRETALSTTGTFTPFTQARAGKTIFWTGGSVTNMDTFASTGASQTNIPDGAKWTVQNDGAGALTFRGGTSVTIRFYAGTGAPADADVTIARGGIANIRKVNDTTYDISGIGLS